MALAREQITIVDLHDGVDGSTYSLNILGGTRTISYNATGKSPTPTQTAYSCELYKDGVKVTPSSYAWSASGHLSGTSTAAGFTPTVVPTYNASLTSSNVVSLTAAYKGMVFKGTVQVVVTKAATDAKLITLVADSQVFKVVGKTVSPTTAKITAETQNTSVTAWTYSSNGAAFTGTLPAGVTRSGSTVTVTGASMTAQTIAVKASDGTYSDVMTIVKVADGKEGKSGAPAVQPVTGFLTNESVTFPADFNGNVTGHTGPLGSFKVFQGTTDVTASADFTASNNVGGTVSISDTGIYTLNSLFADRASVDLKAVYGGVSIVKTLTISKSRAGTPGPEGYTVILTNESHVFPGLESKAVAGSSATSNIIVYKGPTQIASSVAVTGAPTGMNVTVAGDGGKSNSFTAAIDATTPMTTMNGELTVTVTADGKTFPKKFSFAVAKKGTNGAPGSPARVVKIIPSALDFVTKTVSSNPASYVYAPSSIALTPTFQSCTYSKWQYSINGSTWTNVTTQNGLSINSTSKVLTVSSSSTLFSATQSFLIFKCLSSTGEADVVTLNRIFDSGALGSRLRTAEINLSEQEGKIALRATQEEVNAIDTRLSEAEVKVEPGSIVSTVRKSTDYINDQGKKVSTNEIISKINQSAEKITIQASKINIQGAVEFSSFDTALQDELNSKARTFTSTPVPPYSLGDIWKNSTSTYMCKVARATGSYVASDWEKTGDVTSANKAADTAKVGGTAATTVVTGATAGSAAKTATDRWTYTGKTTINGGQIQADTVTATQIKAKTITASEIAANTITVNQLASSVGSSLDLSSNEAITSRVTSTQLSTALKGKADSIFIQDSTPAHKVGRLWLDTSTDPNQLKRSDGTKWVVVNDVQVGGRNLLKNTGLTDGTSGWSGVSIHNLNGESVFRVAGTMSENANIPLEPNQYYTTTMELYPTVDVPITSSTPLHTYYRSSAGNNGGVDTKIMLRQGVAKANEWTRITEVVKTNQNVTTYKFHVYYPTYINSTTPAYVKNIKFEKGNMATDWTPAPEDIQADMDKISGEVGDVSGALTTLDGHVKGAFKDGIISEAEARAIEKYLNIVNSEKADVDAKYTKLYANTLLAGTAKTGLYSVKSTYNTAHTNLISAINTAIRGGKATNAEKTNVDAKFTAYRTALTNLSTAFEVASAYLVDAVNGRFDGPTGVITRLNEAESKVTDDAIIGTVSQKTTSDGKPLFAKTSEVKQTVDTWTAKFSSIGGVNLLKATESTISNTSYPTATYTMAENMVAGQKYTITIWGQLGAGKSSFTAYLNGGSIQLTTIPLKSTGVYRATFTGRAGTTPNPNIINIYPMPSGVSATSRIDKVQLEKGEVGTEWTPHPDELYTGVTKINKDGVTVSRSDSDIKTEVTYSGTKISDDHGTIANFGETTHMPFANIDEVQSDDVVGTVFNPNHVHGNYEYEIGKGKSFTTISEALDAIFSGGSRRFLVNDTNIRLYINGTIEDKVLLRGIAGNGRIYIFFRTGAKLYGSIWARDCMNRIYIRSSTTTGTGRGMIIADNPDKGYAVFNEASKHVHLISMDINAKLKTAAVQGNDTGTTILDSCDVVGGTYGTWCRYSHTLRAVNCRGNATHGHYADQLGIQLIGGTTCINGSSANINQSSPTGGLSLKAGTPSGTSSAFSPPPTSDKEFTQTFRAISLRTKTSTGEWQTYYGSTAAQNRWASTSPYSVGQITFSSDVYSFIKDRKTGTTPTIRIRMRRKNTSHGASAAIKPDPANFSSTAFSSVSGAVQGGWTGWGKLTVSNFSTSGNTLLTIGTGKTDVNYNPYRYYAIWDIAEVEVTKIKNV